MKFLKLIKEDKKIGYPNAYDLAKEIYEAGFRSCDQVNKAGWFLTKDEGIRQEINTILMWFEKTKDVV